MSQLGFSYIRFSSKPQERGDSLRRQTELAASWCKRHDVTLDASTTLHDLGKSAFTGAHRVNPDRHALAGFLKLVEQGRVPRGSYFIIENLDRLSREHIQPALILVLNLLQAGIRIVQLSPAELVFDDKSEMPMVMLMVIELSRGHSESAMKSERIGAAWKNKRVAATKTGALLTRSLPAWLTTKGATITVKPGADTAIRQIYALAAAGYGLSAIARKLTADHVPPIGPSGRWDRAYIMVILNDRRAMGEFQPRKRDKTTVGEPIPSYFPAIVNENEWLAAQAHRTHHKRIRTTKHIFLFSGILVHARTGENYTSQKFIQRTGEICYRLVNREALTGIMKYYLFPERHFEHAILSMLKELSPKDVLRGKHQHDETQTIAGQLAQVELKITELENELMHGNVSALANVLRRLESQKADLATRLQDARKKAMHPLAESWGTTQSLLAHAEGEENRIALRSALRRIIDTMHILVVSKKPTQHLAIVQIRFTGGTCRDYAILSSAGCRYKKAACEVSSFVSDTIDGDLDLRNPEHVAALESALLATL